MHSSHGLNKFSHMFHRTDILRPAIHDGVLAPTESQRLKYGSWLCVYGKDIVQCTHREGTLIDEYIVCDLYYPLFSLTCTLLFYPIRKN